MKFSSRGRMKIQIMGLFLRLNKTKHKKYRFVRTIPPDVEEEGVSVSVFSLKICRVQKIFFLTVFLNKFDNNYR